MAIVYMPPQVKAQKRRIGRARQSAQRGQYKQTSAASRKGQDEQHTHREAGKRKRARERSEDTRSGSSASE